MCEPTTILMAASAGVNAIGAYRGAQAQKQAYEQNAAYDEQRVTDTINAGGEQIFARRLQEAQMRGTQTANLAARGIDVSSGSAFRILQDTKYISNLDVNTIADNTQRDAWALRQQAGANRAKAASISPGMAAVTSLLGGATSVYNNHYDLTH